jgi:succinoglycan biosynthesis protein ExoA
MDNPAISIVVLTLNSSKYIERCLNSLKMQTLQDFEALVVDAGSTDDTQAIVQSFDQRFRWLVLPKSDMGSARNHGMRMSHGAFICFLDSDDFYLPNKIELQLKELRARPEVDVVYCAAWHFRTDVPYRVGLKKLSAQPKTLKDYMEGRNHNLSTMFLRRSVWDAGFCFGEGDRGRYGEEWRLQLSMAQCGVPMVFIAEPLTVVEIRSDSHTSWSRQWMMKNQAINEIKHVASLLTPAQHATIDVQNILDALRCKLVVALQLDGRKCEARQVAASISNALQARKARLLVAFCGLLPKALLCSLIRWGWLAQQNRSFDWHTMTPELQAVFTAVTSVGSSDFCLMKEAISIPPENTVSTLVASFPTVSIVLPVRNEAAHIEHILNQVFGQDYPAELIELIIADGESDDGTPDIAAAFRRDGRSPVVLRLTERGRSQGLNRGILTAKNQIILRLDARTSIPRDYVSSCVATLLRTGADNVGGLQRPIGTTWRQHAFAVALSNPFGVGYAQFRLGKKSDYVESVYLGCFRREVFDRIGYFDEVSPIISEDADINLRIRQAGGKVYLNTQIVAHYKLRERFIDLFRLFYRYGGAKAGILLKHKRLTSWRQIVPPLLLLVLVVLGVVSLLVPWVRQPLLGLAGAYLLANVFVSVRAAFQQRKAYLVLLLFGTFIVLHFGYALGYWKRLLVPETPGNYWKN